MNSSAARITSSAVLSAPKLNRTLESLVEWLGKENGPHAKLENEKEAGVTIAYDELIKQWAAK